MPSDLVNSPSGIRYSLTDWLNGRCFGPFDEFHDFCGGISGVHACLIQLSLVDPDFEISDDSYNDLLDEFCLIRYGRLSYSSLVSDLIVVCMNLPNSLTAHDEALGLIWGMEEYLCENRYGPTTEKWQYTEYDKSRTLRMWQQREDVELLWERKTRLVSREVFMRRVRGRFSMYRSRYHQDHDDLLKRMAVEEIHLKTYLRAMPLQQAVGLLSRIEEKVQDYNPSKEIGRHHAEVVDTSPFKAPERVEARFLALLSVYSNGVADELIKKAELVRMDCKLTANEKLTEINRILAIPPTASAALLAKALGVSKQAVMKTDWWNQNRKRVEQCEISRRHILHQERSKGFERRNLRSED